MTDHRDEHEPYGFTESPVIARLHTEIARLTAERNEARRDAERWQADALRLLNERNAAQGERDEARRMVCNLESRLDWQHGNIDPARFSPMAIAEQRGWVCFKEGTK